ncbi:ORF6N domain-containing protein [Mucilaginibacter sp.]|uniref:ORF6N domain-containing protein n=1 Tax=Mucilaginibacter sp. TaxID=1882438 RepID=UPI0026053F66|nr:ORF6N domain-containing protein [Mucilaginibacter sp.]MDB4921853.1 hypothetical protein [Mucilaginibacter sp.]
MNDITSLNEEVITGKIYFIRRQKVMLDNDLAALYNVETKVLKQAVKRNALRFPESYMFELTQDEFQSLRSQNAASNEGRGGTRYLPMAFSEYGILQISNVLKSQRAIKVSFLIIDVFVKLRKTLSDQTEIWLAIEKIKGKLDNQDKSMEIIFRYLDELSERIPQVPEPGPRKRIGYKPDNE